MNESLLTFSLPYPQLLLILWLVAFVTYVIFSLIFVYHWRAYATDIIVIRRTLLLYFISTGICLAVAGLTVLTM